ncbi:MAG: response regulator [Proteobacteria bacterium]|nr:response regulator [Pseudomonadota bacterium]MBU1687221.1 response regulator [Pseudomonadota bacterium]
MKSLVVEDDFFAGKLLTKYLSALGEVDTAANGEEAIVAVVKQINETHRNYDLICLDIMMPKIDGQQALKGIRELEKKGLLKEEECAKIFMTTAFSDRDQVVEAAKYGCTAYIIKPVNRNKFYEALYDHGLTKINWNNQ